MTISKKIFLQIIHDIKKEDERLDQIATFLESNIITGYANLNPFVFRNTIELILEEIFTEEGFDLIFWWLYEDVEKVIYEGESEIQLKTEEDLYEYLIKNYVKEKNNEKN